MINKKENYLATFDILLTITMLSNEFNEELESNAKKVVSFIAEAFKLDQETTNNLQKVVPDDLTVLSIINDAEAFLNTSGYLEYPDIANLLYIKSEVLMKLNNIFNIFNNEQFNQYDFDYRHLRPYFANTRFNELEAASVKGNILINRTVALMLAMGIGVEKNVKSAIYRLKQCAYWGDVSSFYYLAYLYEQEEDEKNAKLYANLAILSKYLLEGRTLIPNEEQDQYDEETKRAFELIASIQQDVILAYRKAEIDYSLIEVILMDEIDYFVKMQFVNNYQKQQWKEFTNSSYDPSKKLGFNTKAR